MESTDRQILALLSADGRMSYTDIGKATGLSTSAAQQRVRRLEQRGLITGYHASLSAEALGHPLTAFVETKAFDPADDDKAARLLEAMPEVVSCWSVAGDASYVVLVQVANTAELDALLSRIRGQAKMDTTTTVVLTTHFRDRTLVAPSDA
ncbi:Lrp/AsnC family transcriptional regulator [Aestuariimicrobium ganziense]|uniref:Lrp/AsnC family transcriptional regulator n=1 Tax=Aestuariimicrobium ganziense TaxID=2773677 RepID=UPI001941F5F3|nr:Lrp/AsnC family transcriptional regulator [Aestuariimicrobium ganziense]